MFFSFRKKLTGYRQLPGLPTGSLTGALTGHELAGTSLWQPRLNSWCRAHIVATVRFANFLQQLLAESYVNSGGSYAKFVIATSVRRPPPPNDRDSPPLETPKQYETYRSWAFR